MLMFWPGTPKTPQSMTRCNGVGEEVDEPKEKCIKKVTPAIQVGLLGLRWFSTRISSSFYLAERFRIGREGGAIFIL